MQRLWTTVPEHLSSHSALSSYVLFVPLALRRLSCLITTSGSSPVELPSFWGSTVFRYALIPRKGSGNNSNVIIKHIHRFELETTPMVLKRWAASRKSNETRLLILISTNKESITEIEKHKATGL